MIPSISVIVPNYNHAPYLKRRIDSILAQTRHDFELLILDDCSPDNSRDVILSYSEDPRVRSSFNTSNSGNTFSQWAKGLAQTSGDYVWIAESDDFAEPNFLERLAGKLDEDPEAGLAFCETVVVDAQEQWFQPYFERWRGYPARDYGFGLAEREFVMDGREYIRRFMLPWNTIPNVSAVLFRRSAFDAIGGPVTSMKLCGDWLTYCKILANGKVAHVPDLLNYFREHSVNVRSKTHGDTLAREALSVVQWAERTLGKLPAATKRQMRRFRAEALLTMERRAPDLRVPFTRMPAALARACMIEPRLLPATLISLLRQIGGSVLRRLGHNRGHSDNASAATR